MKRFLVLVLFMAGGSLAFAEAEEDICELPGFEELEECQPVGMGDYEKGYQDGMQFCQDNPAQCQISGSAEHGDFSVEDGILYVPYVDVPGPFGGYSSI